MSTNLTATLPDLPFASAVTAGPLPSAPTMPVDALAWSAEDPVDEPIAPAPAVLTKTPPSGRATPALIAALLFGAVTAAAVLGAVLLGGQEAPSATPVVDRTSSAPFVPQAPAPVPPVTAAVAPVPVQTAAQIATPVVPAPAVSPPKIVVATPPVVQPTANPRTPVGQYDWDHHKWDHFHSGWNHQDPKY